MVERRPVKAIVVGSSPTSGAKTIDPALRWVFRFGVRRVRTREPKVRLVSTAKRLKQHS